jgi:hypothetical protein
VYVDHTTSRMCGPIGRAIIFINGADDREGGTRGSFRVALALRPPAAE